MAQEVQHSPNYEILKRKYELNYITQEQLLRWVAINKKNPALGITQEEYYEITGSEK